MLADPELQISLSVRKQVWSVSRIKAKLECCLTNEEWMLSREDSQENRMSIQQAAVLQCLLWTFAASWKCISYFSAFKKSQTTAFDNIFNYSVAFILQFYCIEDTFHTSVIVTECYFCNLYSWRLAVLLFVPRLLVFNCSDSDCAPIIKATWATFILKSYKCGWRRGCFMKSVLFIDSILDQICISWHPKWTRQRTLEN